MSTAPKPSLTSVTPEFATTYRDVLLDRMELELKATSRTVGAIPDAKKDYRPDPKSRTAWELGWHILVSDVWFLNSLADGKFEFTGVEPPPAADTVAGIVAWYQKEIRAALDRVRTAPVEKLTATLDFFGILKQPAVLFLIFAHEHLVHHRGQLTAYLRAMGSKVPDIYGGSADEPFTGQ
jgi:uncharacterized damage-inducible protein DinB